MTGDWGSRRAYALALWVLMGLFLGRVLGQVLVAFFDADFLPPMPEWYSGLLPYPILLPVQIVILAAMLKINWDVSQDRGYFSERHERTGMFLFWSAVVYVLVMVARYFISGSLHPERRWFPQGSIPIIFHLLLAAYLFTLSRLALRVTPARAGSGGE